VVKNICGSGYSGPAGLRIGGGDGRLHRGQHVSPRRRAALARRSRRLSARRSAPTATTGSDRSRRAGTGGLLARWPLPPARADRRHPAWAWRRASCLAKPTPTITEGRDRGFNPGNHLRHLLARRLRENRNLLGFLFMLPATAVLLVFLSYPLVKGIWLGLHRRASRPRRHVPSASTSADSLAGTTSSGCRCFNTFYYTFIATILKFALGLWLALLLNEHMPFKALTAPRCCCPISCRPCSRRSPGGGCTIRSSRSSPTCCVKLGLIDHYIDFLGNPWNARWSLIVANVWRGIPFVAICLLAGLQTISPSLLRGGALDGATPWQRFSHVTCRCSRRSSRSCMTFSCCSPSPTSS
jgi:multiple sugar transport system permease protein